MDVSILYELQQGYAAFINKTSASGPAAKWLLFFEKFVEPGIKPQDLIGFWGEAEEAATKKGMAIYGSSSQKDDQQFLAVGNLYRTLQHNLCPRIDCTDGFFDPRTTTNEFLGSIGVPPMPIYGDRSPVALALYPIYFGDYISSR